MSVRPLVAAVSLAVVAAGGGAASAVTAAAATAARAGAAPVRPAPVFTRAIADNVRPVGLVGERVVLEDRRGLVLLGARGPGRRLLARRDVRRSVVAGGRLAVVTGPGRRRPADALLVSRGRGAGPRTVRLGPVGGRLAVVQSCPAGPGGEIAPALSGAIAAWRGCSPEQVVVDAADGRRALAASGPVVAVAVAGRRVAWIATHGRAFATLELADLDAGTTTTVDELPPLRPGDRATLALADDRVAVAVPFPSDFVVGGGCQASAGPPTGPLQVLAEDDCPVTTFLAPGLTLSGARLVRGDRSRALLRGPSVTGATADAEHAAVTHADCRTSRLTLLPLRGTAPRARDCPLRVGGRPALVRPDGRVRFPVSCPNGCRVPRREISLEGGLDTDGAIDALRGLDLPPGGRGHVAFRLQPRLRNRVLRGEVHSRVLFATRHDGVFDLHRVRFRVR